MASLLQNVVVARGQDAFIYVQMNPPVDISAWTLLATVAMERNSPTKLLQKACTLTTPATGLFLFNPLAAELAALEPAVYYWDVWRTNAGQMEPVTEGTFEVTGNARQPV